MRLAWLAVMRSSWKASATGDELEQSEAGIDEAIALARFLGKGEPSMRLRRFVPPS